MFATLLAAVVVLWGINYYLLYSKYELVDLGTLGGACDAARAVNNIGQVVGWSKRSNSGTRDPDHAFVWDEKLGMRDLGKLGGATSWTRDINDKGQVVGFAYTSDGGALVSGAGAGGEYLRGARY